MDIQLYYEEQGQGQPLLLLHGNGEDSTYFVHQMAYFSKYYRVIAVDTRGHGKSPRGTEPFTIRQFAEDLRCFMDQMGLAKAHILGFSDGGNTALMFAMTYPERVDRLILNGANLDGKGVKPSVQLPIILGYHMASHFAKKSARAKQNAEMLGLMVDDPKIPVEALAKVKAKTLVIAGDKDMIKKSHTQRIFDHLPQAQMILLPGDHFVAHKNPKAFNEAVAAFLAAPRDNDNLE